MAVARVDSIDAIRAFRVSVIKFCEAANVALADAEGDMSRTLMWLENEQLTHWTGQIRKRHDALEKAKEQLRMKKLYKDASGSRQSYVDEQKAVDVCTRRLEEAHHKLDATKKWIGRMRKEILMYAGQAQRFATTLQSEMPQATAFLGNVVTQLDAYVGANPTDAASTAATVPADGNMKRGEGMEADAEKKPDRPAEPNSDNSIPDGSAPPPAGG